MSPLAPRDQELRTAKAPKTPKRKFPVASFGALAVNPFLSFVLLTALVGCLDDDPSAPGPATCNESFTGRALEGDWALSGSGTRSECSSRRLDGDLELSTAIRIPVEATAQATSGPSSGPEPSSEADAFVSRIERADYLLAVSDDAPNDVVDNVTLQGGVNGSCVSFDLTESLPRDDEIVYHFDGFITGNGYARGEFWGTGPGECEVEGEFELVVR